MCWDCCEEHVTLQTESTKGHRLRRAVRVRTRHRWTGLTIIVRTAEVAPVPSAAVGNLCALQMCVEHRQVQAPLRSEMQPSYSTQPQRCPPWVWLGRFLLCSPAPSGPSGAWRGSVRPWPEAHATCCLRSARPFTELLHCGQRVRAGLRRRWWRGPSSLNLGSSVLFTDPGPGMAWTTMDIAIMAGELAQVLPAVRRVGGGVCRRTS